MVAIIYARICLRLPFCKFYGSCKQIVSLACFQLASSAGKHDRSSALMFLIVHFFFFMLVTFWEEGRGYVLVLLFMVALVVDT